MTAWRPIEPSSAWLLHGEGPQLLVRTQPWEFDQQVELAEDPQTFTRLIVELVAHHATDQQLGAFVRLVAEKRLDLIRAAGSGKWSRRVRVLEDVTSPELPGSF